MFTFVVSHSLVIVVEADLLGGQHFETSYLDTVSLGHVNEVFSVLFLGIGVVNDHTIAFGQFLTCNFITFFFSLESVPVNSYIFGKIIYAEGGLARSWGSYHQHHLLFDKFHCFSFAYN